MDNLINEEIIKKTTNIFKKLFNMKIRPGDIFVGKSGEHDWDISGVVGIVGYYEGVITIRLKDESAIALLEKSRIDSPEQAKRWHMINDMVGEIVNNIVGNVLGEIVREKFKNSVPITVQGKNHILQWPDNAPIVVIPFDSEMGNFEVQYSLLKK